MCGGTHVILTGFLNNFAVTGQVDGGSVESVRPSRSPSLHLASLKQQEHLPKERKLTLLSLPQTNCFKGSEIHQ